MSKSDEIKKTIETLLDGYMENTDLELYKIEYRKEGPSWKLRVFIDKKANAEQEYVGIDDCEKVNEFLSEKLDESGIIDKQYDLEVSSPGLDRELIKDSDFTRFAGREVEIKLYEAMDGVKTLDGELEGLKDGFVEVLVGDEIKKIERSKISKINLKVIF